MYRHEGQGDRPIQGFRFRRAYRDHNKWSQAVIDDQTYAQQQEADAAITQMNDQELDGRRVRVCPHASASGSVSDGQVNMANTKPAGGGGYGGGGYNSGYGGGAGGYGGGGQGGYGGGGYGGGGQGGCQCIPTWL